MTKLLIAGDFHGNHPWAKKIIDVAKAENISKIMQVGDFGVWPGKNGQEYLDILSRHLVKQDVKLYFLPGNHEDYNQIQLWEHQIEPNLQGHREVRPNLFYTSKVNGWKWEHTYFASVGGAVSVDKAWRKLDVSWWPQEQLTQEEAEKAISFGHVDYLFTHDCPPYHPFQRLKPDAESVAHRQRIGEVAAKLMPMRWFHGHYHECADYDFWHAGGMTNVHGLDADPQASLNVRLYEHTIVLDTHTDEVSRISKLFNWHARSFYFDRKHKQDGSVL